MLERFLSHKRFESIHLLVTYLLKNCCAIPLLNFWIILQGSSSLVTRFNSGKGIHSNIRKQFLLQKEQTKKNKTKQNKNNNNNSYCSSSSSSSNKNKNNNSNNNDNDNDNDDDVDNYNDAAIRESLFSGNSMNYEKGDG